MRLRLQFGGMVLTPLLMAALVVSAAAQKPHAPAPPQRQERKQERPQQKPANQAHPQSNRPPNARTNTPPPPIQRNAQSNRPPDARNNAANVPQVSRNSGATKSPQMDERNRSNRPPRQLTPEEHQRVEQSQQQFNKLSPQQRQEYRNRAEVWGRLTPEQRQHIRNDVLPKWEQLPADRQRAIGHRLGVLQNMPESARNQHLNDPNFTRGMSEEDKSTLRDLSHLHVGGAPDPPSE